MSVVQRAERLSAWWWIVLLRGILALGLAAIIFPAAGVMRTSFGVALASFFVQSCFGVYLFLASLLSIWLTVATIPRSHWPFSLGHSAFLILLAWWFVAADSSSIVPLAVLVAIHAAAVGATEMSFATHLRGHRLQSTALFAAGLLSFCAAVTLLALHGRPPAIARVISGYAGLFGIALVVAAFQLRAIRGHVVKLTSAQASFTVK